MYLKYLIHELILYYIYKGTSKSYSNQHYTFRTYTLITKVYTNFTDNTTILYYL